MPIDAASTTTPASANFEKLKAKLRELFELDKADLDFGIYRVLRARHREIAEFLDKHLEKTVREALQSHNSVHQSQLSEDLRKAEQAAKDAGINPEQSPRVLELREKLKAGNDLDALADEVYSHLYTFFSRYYHEGDFLGLQRSTVHGREKYMIPYNGEEVKLIWANMDQYYIKSSELLRDYVFQIAPGAGTLLEAAATERFTVHFKLMEADTEKDDRKPSGKTIRAFALDDESPFAEDDPNTLTIRFCYREYTAERNLQDKLNADTEKALADNLPAKWRAVLFVPDPTYQGKDKKDTRTILQKHLRSYTAKYQFDYFIHKDLGGFLRRELAFYIKNEVMYLDDIEESSAPKAEEYLSKIRALRRCAVPVIGMLEQLEQFQKKLWLKKKFVVETRYCITLDRVPETLYLQIAASAPQRDEWVRLYAINEIKKDLAQPGYSEPLTVEFLKANPYLMIDTRHFSREFAVKLLASVENLDEMLDGVCFHSENFQALQLMQERYREQAKCVYIDPPYNTGSDGFCYKDGYRHSSWYSMIVACVRELHKVMSPSGLFAATIDDDELAGLLRLLKERFGESNLAACAPWQSEPSGGKEKTGLRTGHEYLSILYKEDSGEISTDERSTGALNLKDKWGNYRKGRELRKWGGTSLREDRSGQFYPLPTPFGDDALPIRNDGKEGHWRWGKNNPNIQTALKDPDFFHWEKTPYDPGVSYGGQTERWTPYEKIREERKTVGWSTWLDDVGINADATRQLKDLFGFKAFDTPKPLQLIEWFLKLHSDAEGLAVDTFAGSGVLGHAVINVNRDGDTRRYLLVEMGEYFDTVLAPRLKKVVYSIDWKDGKPQNRNTGISHAFKIVRLESYEDTLNNLLLKRTPEQEAALQSAPEKARDQYLLCYFLDVESAGSASLLDLDQLRDPFAYKLKIATSSAGETIDTTVDLVETFNWLLGLKVKHIDAQKGFLTVTGEKRAGGRVLVIWRTLSDDTIADNKALEDFLSKIAVNPADTEFDYVYINGSHTLTDPHNKVHLTEEAFQRLMFDTPDFGMEA